MPSAQYIISKYSNGVLTTKITYCLNKIEWKEILDHLHENKVDGMTVEQSPDETPFYCSDSDAYYVEKSAVITLNISEFSYNSVLEGLRRLNKHSARVAISGSINRGPDDLSEGYLKLMLARKQELLSNSKPSIPSQEQEQEQEPHGFTL